MACSALVAFLATVTAISFASGCATTVQQPVDANAVEAAAIVRDGRRLFGPPSPNVAVEIATQRPVGLSGSPPAGQLEPPTGDNP